MASGGIYQITNQVNGNRYIGSAVNFAKRWQRHLRNLRHGRHHNRRLQVAFDKYGEDAFAFSVLEHIEDTTQLIPREQYHLDTLEPEYNIAPTAGSPMLGRHHTPEARAKMSEVWMGHPVSAETRAKISAAQMDRVVSDQTRAKLSAAVSGDCNPNYGKHPSEKSRRHMSEAQKARRLRERAARD